MAREKIISAIDVGSSKIRVITASLTNEKNLPLSIVGYGIADCFGIKKGNIIDMEDLVNSIEQALIECEKMSGYPVKDVLVSVNGEHLKSDYNRGIVAVNNIEIKQSDIDRAIDNSMHLPHYTNREIIRVIPLDYIIDDHTSVKDPLGMIGKRLEVSSHIISGMSNNIHNLQKAISSTNVHMVEMIPAPIAAAESILQKRQKELGVAIIDIGASTTSVVVYEEGLPIYTAYIPIAGDKITSDIAIGLRTSIDTAEKLKKEFGSCLIKEVNKRDMISLSQLSKLDTHDVSKHTLTQIIEARLYEILIEVKNLLRSIEKDGMLPAGIILTGGNAKIPGVVDMTKDILSLPAQIGFPLYMESIVEELDDPEFATAIGLLYTYKNLSMRKVGTNISFNFSPVNIYKNVRDWFKTLFP